MRLNGQWLGNEASTFTNLSSFLPPLLHLIDKYLVTSSGSKGHNQQPAQLPLRVDDSYVAFDGTSCCLWLNEESLARRVDELVAVGGVGITVRVLCECHLCVPQLSEEMWWRVWKRKAINKTEKSVLPLSSHFFLPPHFFLSSVPFPPSTLSPHSTSPFSLLFSSFTFPPPPPPPPSFFSPSLLLSLPPSLPPSSHSHLPFLSALSPSQWGG